MNANWKFNELLIDFDDIVNLKSLHWALNYYQKIFIYLLSTLHRSHPIWSKRPGLEIKIVKFIMIMNTSTILVWYMTMIMRLDLIIPCKIINDLGDLKVVN